MKLTDYFIQWIILLHLTVVGFIKPEVAERAKRMLFLTSLATALAQEGIVKRNVLDSLNYDLKLARNDHCLLVGKELSSGMWSNNKVNCSLFKEGWDGGHDPIGSNDKVELDRFLTLDDIRTLSTKLIKAAPGWVKYDSNRMQADVTDFFITHPTLKSIKA